MTRRARDSLEQVPPARAGEGGFPKEMDRDYGVEEGRERERAAENQDQD